MARPGAAWPDPRRLDAHLALLGPTGSHGVNPGLELDPRSGLPTLRALLGVRADREVAQQGRGRRSPARAAYDAALLAAELQPLSEVTVRLRRQERRQTLLEAVHDGIDPASGLPVRCTFRFAQQGAALVEEGARPTRQLTTLVERAAAADAEVGFVLLSGIGGVHVEEVVRGVLGPLHLAGVPAPELLAPLFDEVPGGMLLHLVLERASREVAVDSCRDPLAAPERLGLVEEARRTFDERRAGLGFRVARERRLVCTPGLEAPLRARLARAGVALVVRSA